MTPTAELIPNLDALEPEELIRFAEHYKAGRNNETLFPDQLKGRRTATADLAIFAHNKTLAIRYRLAGQVEDAQIYERVCDRVYKRLPSWAKSW